MSRGGTRASTAAAQTLDGMLRAHEVAWERFAASKAAGLVYSDVPWPDAGATVPNALLTFALQQAGDVKAELRKLQVRWHPDKWAQRYAARLEETQAGLVLERVKEISQLVNGMKVSS